MQSYPLGALFLLVAIFAVLTAIIGRLRSIAAVNIGELILAGGWGGVAGMLAGVIIGLYHFHRVKGFFLGAVMGAIVGVLCGPIVLLSQSHPVETLGVAVAGVFVLNALAFAYSYANSADPMTRRQHYDELLAKHQIQSKDSS